MAGLILQPLLPLCLRPAHLALAMLAQHNWPGRGQKWWIALGVDRSMVN